MKHTYNITGMSCTGCQAKVQQLLSGVDGVEKVTVDLPNGKAEIDMQHISLPLIEVGFKRLSKISIGRKK